MDQSKPNERIDQNINSLAEHQTLLQEMIGDQGKKLINLHNLVTQQQVEIQALRTDINILKAMGIGHGPTAAGPGSVT